MRFCEVNYFSTSVVRRRKFVFFSGGCNFNVWISKKRFLLSQNGHKVNFNYIHPRPHLRKPIYYFTFLPLCMCYIIYLFESQRLYILKHFAENTFSTLVHLGNSFKASSQIITTSTSVLLTFYDTRKPFISDIYSSKYLRLIPH